MANDKVLVSSGGVTRTVPDADTALVGSGVRSNVGQSLTIVSDTGACTVDSAAALVLGNTTATSIAVGHSGVTTTVTGGLTQLTGAVSLTGNAASSFTTSAGALTLTSAAAATWSTAAGALTVDSAAALNLGNTNATSLAVGHSGITTTVTGGLTQLTGAVSLTGNAASQFSTTSGALTLTGAAASTWSTAAGALTLNGFAGMNLQNNGTTNLTVGPGTLVIQSGVTLSATGTGQINLPQNFLVNSVATIYANPGINDGTHGQVSALALNVITAGPTSNADSYHTHSFTSGSSETAGATITAGQLVAFQNNGGTGNVYPASASNGTPALQNVIGVATTSAVATGTTNIVYGGPVNVPNALFSGTTPVAANIGSRVYLDDVAGNWNLTAPSTSGDYAVHTGVIANIPNGSNVTVWLQIGEGVIQ